ncbi:Cell cycle serine/threonine-protein kinase cdc5/MSD2 [Linnemannia exigua]|uniref:Cell cycle serine/threonine-protein kinase cdc5/MSD2 n=1 Tax=Linnemannia exigua TaxID=604196 RepID=A0AAD4DAC0_9FUNG|nr:Cell cycle serine/threonine-protein kinase cdc5/MSD2 [Linnemannia exigua]
MSSFNCLVPQNNTRTDESPAKNYNSEPTTPTNSTTPHSNSSPAPSSNLAHDLDTNSGAALATTASHSSGSSHTLCASWASLELFESEKGFQATVPKGSVGQTSSQKRLHDGSVDELYKSTDSEGGFGRVFNVMNKEGDVFALKTFWGDISDVKNCGTITEAETRFFISEIAEGLSHLHGNVLIHRDIKPNNIMFALGMRLRIGDLGLAARNQAFPKSLEDLLTKDECKLKPDAKKLVMKLLDFDPEELGEEVFDREPALMTEGKRKADESEADEKAKVKLDLGLDEKTAVKVKLDLDDPFCDTAVLYLNTDSYEAGF